MAQDDDLKKIDLRISKLESMLEKALASRQPTDLSADEIKAYYKVRDVVAADYGEFCGINDCFRCNIIRCVRCYTPPRLCTFCDVECSCGPCSSPGGRFGGNIRRFSDMGE